MPQVNAYLIVLTLHFASWILSYSQSSTKQGDVGRGWGLRWAVWRAQLFDTQHKCQKRKKSRLFSERAAAPDWLSVVMHKQNWCEKFLEQEVWFLYGDSVDGGEGGGIRNTIYWGGVLCYSVNENSSAAGIDIDKGLLLSLDNPIKWICFHNHIFTIAWIYLLKGSILLIIWTATTWLARWIQCVDIAYWV